VAEHLSAEWYEEMAAAAAAAEVPEGPDVVLQQVVTDEHGQEEAYALRIRGGRVELVRGRVADADVTFTQDRATAAAVAQGSLSAQAAFLAGRLRIGGDLHRFAEAAAALAAIDDVFGSVRATTRF
jgi:putative sterol carrier protein